MSSPHDILVKIKAASLNPADYKKGANDDKKGSKYDQPVILGFDAAGIVEQLGSAVTHFKVGDAVYYSGNIKRDGTLQQYQLVDARLVALKPKTLSFEEAAALPLTTITAYEALKEELRVQPGKRILITAGAGGVGSIASQLAKHWGLTVITSASRPETIAWTKAHGADYVVDHKKGIAESFKAQNLDHVEYVFNTFSDVLLPDIIQVVKPFGAVCGINGNLTDKVRILISLTPPLLQAHRCIAPAQHYTNHPLISIFVSVSVIVLVFSRVRLCSFAALCCAGGVCRQVDVRSPHRVPPGVHVRQGRVGRQRAECGRPAARGGRARGCGHHQDHHTHEIQLERLQEGVRHVGESLHDWQDCADD